MEGFRSGAVLFSKVSTDDSNKCCNIDLCVPLFLGFTVETDVEVGMALHELGLSLQAG